MLTIRISEKKLIDQKVACYAFFLPEGFSNKDIKTIAQHFNPDLPQLLKDIEFTGKLHQVRCIPMISDNKTKQLIFVGLGSKKYNEKIIDIEQYRRALGHAIKTVMLHKCESFAMQMPPAHLFGETLEYVAKQTALIANMAAYHFNEYMTDKERKADLFEVIICIDGKQKKQIENGIKEGECIAQAVNKARHWVDLPPTLLTPPYLADKARVIAKKYNNLTIQIFNEKQINEMGMGGLAAVSRGSDLDCCLSILEYKPKKKTVPTLVFVGKGITFDSGGLSLKPAVHMETMKEDMSGAAAVIAAMEAIAQLKPNVHVVGITPLAENLPGSKATKPGDIVRFYNGKTAEIKNTDAEGRLILADALAYAVKHYNPDAIIDIATLTGACAYALGPFYTGLMSPNDDLVDELYQAGCASGDRVWRLPMHDDYKVAIRSQVADICNIGSPKYMAGAITAAHFLQNFVNDVPWAHLDIAGTAYNVPDISYYRPGATGVGVRLLVDLAMNW